MPGEIPTRMDPAEQAAIAAALKAAARRRSLEGNPQPAPTSFLRPGQQYRGAQTVSHLGHSRDEDWCVRVSVLSCDFKSGQVCGTMEAENVPHARSPVTTFWEGEVVDNTHHTFFTGKWGASADTDMKHWSKFACFQHIKEAVVLGGGCAAALGSYPYIFMRWKEQCFMDCSQDCGLTIAGFYYVCMNRQTGGVTGYYYDPNSSPFQKLELNHVPAGTAGHSFAEYSIL